MAQGVRHLAPTTPASRALDEKDRQTGRIDMQKPVLFRSRSGSHLTDCTVNQKFIVVNLGRSVIRFRNDQGASVTESLSSSAQRPPRTMSREARRTQLIEATIETIAARGYARTTLTEVARTAGLSHGLVLFHFETKEKLLAETLAYLAEEYRQNWQAALAAVGDDPAEQLNALIEADFNPAICTPARLSAWCAFWGEAQSRPLYQEAYAPWDDAYNQRLEGVCARLSDLGGYKRDRVQVARVLRLTIEGVWLDIATMAAPYTRDEGLTTARTCASLCFPDHFGPDGLSATRTRS
jgi:TetR/AcrR family transcriptional repressor of bet genes